MLSYCFDQSGETIRGAVHKFNFPGTCYSFFFFRLDFDIGYLAETVGAKTSTVNLYAQPTHEC